MSEREAAPRAMVVYESMFGNTEKIADAVAHGLRDGGYDAVEVDVTFAPLDEPVELDLLVMGAPTHAFSLSRPSTRVDAVRRGASASRARSGLREWLADLHIPERMPSVAVFDTRVAKVRRMPTSAARTAARLAHRRGFKLVARPQGFLVEDVDGPLLEGELARAAEWGRELAAKATHDTAARA